MATRKQLITLLASYCNMYATLFNMQRAQEFYCELFIDNANKYLQFKHEVDIILMQKYHIYPEIEQMFKRKGGID